MHICGARRRAAAATCLEPRVYSFRLHDGPVAPCTGESSHSKTRPPLVQSPSPCQPALSLHPRTGAYGVLCAPSQLHPLPQSLRATLARPQSHSRCIPV
eukprot:scaffold14731_cov94-Isochrysis_galbana.AAC.2